MKNSEIGQKVITGRLSHTWYSVEGQLELRKLVTILNVINKICLIIKIKVDLQYGHSTEVPSKIVFKISCNIHVRKL